MAWIGFCTQCGTDVLLTEACTCPNGHPYESIRDVHDDGTKVPAAEPVAEPHAEPAAEPVTEPHVEPAAEPVTAPYAEPIAEPVAEPHAELEVEQARPLTPADLAYLAVTPEVNTDAPKPARATPASNRRALVMLIGLLNVVLLGGFVVGGSVLAASLNPAGGLPSNAPMPKPKPAVENPAPSAEPTAAANEKPAAPSKPAKPTAPQATPSKPAAAIKPSDAEGTWENVNPNAKLRALVYGDVNGDGDSNDGRIGYPDPSDDKRSVTHEARIEVRADGMIIIEIPGLKRAYQGTISELTPDTLVIDDLGEFRRLPNGTW